MHHSFEKIHILSYFLNVQPVYIFHVLRWDRKYFFFAFYQQQWLYSYGNDSMFCLHLLIEFCKSGAAAVLIC